MTIPRLDVFMHNLEQKSAIHNNLTTGGIQASEALKEAVARLESDICNMLNYLVDEGKGQYS